MARIAPLGITLLLLLATCFFAFETRSKVGDLSDKVTSLNGEVATAKLAASKSQAQLKTAQDDLAKAKTDLATAQSQVTDIQNQLTTANTQIATDKTTIDKLNADIAAKGNSPNPQPVPNGPTPADMEKLNAQLKDAQSQLAELNQVKETLTNKAKDAESRADDLEKQVEHYKQGFMKNGLEGEVLAYNPGWNFVVISLGDHQGAVTNAQMILVRGNEQIGKVRITSVEPSTSVADVIPGSVARGVRIQPGDRVIFPGS